LGRVFCKKEVPYPYSKLSAIAPKMPKMPLAGNFSAWAFSFKNRTGLASDVWMSDVWPTAGGPNFNCRSYIYGWVREEKSFAVSQSSFPCPTSSRGTARTNNHHMDRN